MHPAVLGWTRWTEIGNCYNTGLVLGAMREATLSIARDQAVMIRIISALAAG
jgi:hypothetical protein